MLSDILRRDRERWGMSVREAGWRLGITRRAYVAIEDGERSPNADQSQAICECFGWPDALRVSSRPAYQPPASLVGALAYSAT